MELCNDRETCGKPIIMDAQAHQVKEFKHPTRPTSSTIMQLCNDCETCGKSIIMDARAHQVREVNDVIHGAYHTGRFIKNFFFDWMAEREEMERTQKRINQMDPEQWRELLRLPGEGHVEVYEYVFTNFTSLNQNGPLPEKNLKSFYRGLHNVVKKAVQQRQPLWDSSPETKKSEKELQKLQQFYPSQMPVISGTLLEKMLRLTTKGTTKFSRGKDLINYKNEYMRTYEARYVKHVAMCCFAMSANIVPMQESAYQR